MRRNTHGTYLMLTFVVKSFCVFKIRQLDNSILLQDIAKTHVAMNPSSLMKVL